MPCLECWLNCVWQVWGVGLAEAEPPTGNQSLLFKSSDSCFTLTIIKGCC